MEQEVVFGQKSFSTLKNFIDEKKCKSILLVTGKSSFEKCGAKQDLFSILTPYKITRFSNFEEKPKIEDVEKGVSVFNNNNCDIIIAVGGGSCMGGSNRVLWRGVMRRAYRSSCMYVADMHI